MSVTESVCYEKVVPWSGKRCGRRSVPREPLMAAEDLDRRASKIDVTDVIKFGGRRQVWTKE